MLAMGDELVGSEVAQGLVGSDSVVGSFPSLELPVQGGQVQGEICNFIELFGMDALGPFHTAVELSPNPPKDGLGDSP